jgi:hypothetical protein
VGDEPMAFESGFHVDGIVVFLMGVFPGLKSGTWGTRHRSLVNDGAGTKNVHPRARGHRTA